MIVMHVLLIWHRSAGVRVAGFMGAELVVSRCEDCSYEDWVGSYGCWSCDLDVRTAVMKTGLVLMVLEL
jgi:hypothetical protein